MKFIAPHLSAVMDSITPILVFDLKIQPNGKLPILQTPDLS